MPALVAATAITGIANVVGAHKAAGAAKDAAKVQVASADKAQGVNQQVYNDQRALMQPYIQGGNDAFARLMSAKFGTSGQGTPQGGPPGGQFGQMSAMTGPPQPMPQAMPPQPPQAFGAAMGGGGPLVKIQAPTGETKDVPREQVQHYLGLGARMVN